MLIGQLQEPPRLFKLWRLDADHPSMPALDSGLRSAGKIRRKGAIESLIQPYRPDRNARSDDGVEHAERMFGSTVHGPSQPSLASAWVN